MLGRYKWLWILTIINVTLAFLLLLAIRATLFAIGAFAAYVSTSPLFVLLLLGMAFSLIGVLVAKRVDSRRPRYLGFLANGSTLALHSILLFGMAVMFIGIPQERFLIPEGYVGDVYVVHSIPDGEPEKRMVWGVTYRIPREGILCTRAPMKRGMTRPVYYYERPDGTLKRIRHFWPTTINRTPENLANDRDLGVFFPRTGKRSLFRLSPTLASHSEDCSIEYQQFYVGTKAFLLSKHEHKDDLGRYLSEHSVKCSGRTN